MKEEISMRGFIVSVASLALLSVAGYAENHATAISRAEADNAALGKRHVICDDGDTEENAWRDLISNKLMRHSLIGANAITIDFGGSKISEYDKISTTLQKGYESRIELPHSLIKRPFRIFSTPISFKRTGHWIVCAILSEATDEISVFKDSNFSTSGGEIVFPNGKKISAQSVEREDGKIQLPDGSIIENPNPAVGKVSADLKEALGKKYVLCDDGTSEENAMRDLFHNKLKMPDAFSASARPVDFKKLTLSNTKEISDSIQDQISENKQSVPYVHIKHPFHLYSLPITFQTKSGVWQACLIVSDDMESIQVAPK